ncbi:MAG: S9 family peptidase [Bacteroidetes bacterium]|nr:S9 family peptidase [Bacteroidota bacterium]
MFKILFTGILFGSIALAQPLHYPAAKKVDVVDTYFGVSIADPYRWLEQDTSAEVKKWVNEENAVTFSYLEKIPFRSQIKARLEKLMNYPKASAPFRAGKNWFFYKNDGLQNQSVLYVRYGSLDAKPQVFLDPNKLSHDGTVALTGLSFNKNGTKAAYSISRSGSDWQEIYVMDVKTKKLLSDKIEWAKFTGITWHGNGFYYNRYDVPKDTGKKLSASNEFQKVYYHIIGTPQKKDDVLMQDKKDPYISFGTDFTEDERIMLLSKSKRNSNGNALYFRDLRKRGRWHPVLESYENTIWVIDNIGEKLLLFTNFDAPNGKIVLFDPAHPSAKEWKTIVPEKDEPLTSVRTAGKKLFLTYMKDVSHRVFVSDYNGNIENEISLAALGTVSGFNGKHEDRFVFYTLTSFTYPAVTYKYDITSKISTLYQKTEVDFNPEEYETRQVFYPSSDGTKIPMFIVAKKGIELNGNNPVWLYGYGGFNISINPSFNAIRLAWLEQGGIFAVANIRGGSEYGEKWHQAGMKLQKQNVFNDFIAAAEYLIARNYTNPNLLVCEGRSNGGLLIGAVINQRPDLFRVAFPGVGVMDMLRFQKFTIGWAWVNDYGSSDDSTQFFYLKKYSPLHTISDTLRYPAVFVVTADHDDRVVPAHSFKYIATMQEKYKGDNPILIRIETSAGHGGGKPTSKYIEEWTDMYAFAWKNLGITPKY